MRKNNKRALIVSALSLLLCVSMLVGSTMAWFTDNATASVAKVQAGTLQIELWQTTYNDWMDQPGEEGFEEKNITDSETPIFESNLWEPGYLTYANFTVKNVGTLAAKIKATLVTTEEVGKLAEAIDVYVATVPFADNYDGYTIRQFFNGEYVLPWGGGMNMFDRYVKNVGTLKNVMENGIDLAVFAEGEDTIIEAGENYQVNIALKMRESAGNEYQGMPAGAFDILIQAAQATVEEDSFDNQYDKDAAYAAADNLYITEPGEYSIDLTKTNFIFKGGEIQDTLAAVKVDTGCSTTITGNGLIKIDVTDTTTSSAIAVWARNGGQIVIEDGTYIMERVEDNKQEIELIYVSGAGSAITIKGGTFKSDHPRLTLNIHKSSNGTITVMGGTYWEFNPENAEDAGVIIPEGYKVVEEVKADGTWYTVVAE